MADPTGEADRSALRLDFDRRLLLQFRGSTITSDAGLLAYRALDDALHLTDTAANTLADARTGKNGRHRLAGLLRQAVLRRLAGYECQRRRENASAGRSKNASRTHPVSATPNSVSGSIDRGCVPVLTWSAERRQGFTSGPGVACSV